MECENLAESEVAEDYDCDVDEIVGNQDCRQ